MLCSLIVMQSSNHISQVDYENQSNINIPLDMLMPKIQLMKINRNVEHSITNKPHS